jgi:serine/threonine protein phosphatase PrpC
MMLPAHEALYTTALAAVFSGDRLTIASAGDTRAYLARACHAFSIMSAKTEHEDEDEDEDEDENRDGDGDAAWRHIGEPDMGNTLVVNASARTHGDDIESNEGVLSHGLGPGLIMTPVVCTTLIRNSDRIVLCTDGLWRSVDHHVLAHVVRGHTLARAADALIGTALAYGATDNITAVVIGRRGAHHGA